MTAWAARSEHKLVHGVRACDSRRSWQHGDKAGILEGTLPGAWGLEARQWAVRSLPHAGVSPPAWTRVVFRAVPLFPNYTPALILITVPLKILGVFLTRALLLRYTGS